MKRKFNRAYYFTISFIISSCLMFGFLGVCAAYQNIVKTAYGEYKKAVEISENGFRILDFKYNFDKKSTDG